MHPVLELGLLIALSLSALTAQSGVLEESKSFDFDDECALLADWPQKKGNAIAKQTHTDTHTQAHTHTGTRQLQFGFGQLGRHFQRWQMTFWLNTKCWHAEIFHKCWLKGAIKCATATATGTLPHNVATPLCQCASDDIDCGLDWQLGEIEAQFGIELHTLSAAS